MSSRTKPLPRRLQDLMQARGWRILDLAAALRASEQTVRNWLNSDTEPLPVYRERLDELERER